MTSKCLCVRCARCSKRHPWRQPDPPRQRRASKRPPARHLARRPKKRASGVPESSSLPGRLCKITHYKNLETAYAGFIPPFPFIHHVHCCSFPPSCGFPLWQLCGASRCPRFLARVRWSNVLTRQQGLPRSMIARNMNSKVNGELSTDNSPSCIR